MLCGAPHPQHGRSLRTPGSSNRRGLFTPPGRAGGHVAVFTSQRARAVPAPAPHWLARSSGRATPACARSGLRKEGKGWARQSAPPSVPRPPSPRCRRRTQYRSAGPWSPLHAPPFSNRVCLRIATLRRGASGLHFRGAQGVRQMLVHCTSLPLP